MINVNTIGSVQILKIRASLSGECVEQCRTTTNNLLQNMHGFILLDLTETPLLDSDGLEFLVDLQQRCLRLGGRLVITETNELCREILSITGVDQSVSVTQDMRDGLSEFAK